MKRIGKRLIIIAPPKKGNNFIIEGDTVKIELKRRNEKSLLLNTTKKNISDDMIRKLLEVYLELKDDSISNYDDEIINNTIRGLKRDSIIKWDKIEFVVKGSYDEDYIKLKSKYASAILYNEDYLMFYY